MPAAIRGIGLDSGRLRGRWLRGPAEGRKQTIKFNIMYLQRRNRILRQSPAIRAMVAVTVLTPNDFIVPLFIDEGTGVRQEISSMPGYFRQSLDGTVTEVKELWSLGIKKIGRAHV